MTHTPKRPLMEHLSQVAIFTGALSMLAVSDGNPWGFVISLAIQPFWYYTTFRNKQWGVLLATFIYTLAWVNGVYKNWTHYINAFN